MQTLTENENRQIEAANKSAKQPIVFIHGLWLLPSSWDRWANYFENIGFAALTPGWPDDPRTVEEANADPEVFVGKSISQASDHFESVIQSLKKKPVLVGHSFGGLIAQILAGRGISATTVAIDPAGFRGVLPLPLSALKSASPVLTNPLNRNRAVALTFEQFQYAFANAVGEEEAHELYKTFAVPAAGKPLFQAAAANINPWSEDRVDTKNAQRGPLLIVSGEKDHTVPHAVAHAAYMLQAKNIGVTEFVELPNRGHSLTIDDGWQDVAHTTKQFVSRFVVLER